MAVFWDVAPCIMADIHRSSEDLTAIIRALTHLLMMKAVNSSETLVNFYQTTRCNIPEDSHLHTRRRENMKSH
jgi:hypothetical protein